MHDQLFLEPDFRWLPPMLTAWGAAAAQNVSDAVPLPVGDKSVLAVVSDEGQSVALVPLGKELAAELAPAIVSLGDLLRSAGAALPEDVELDLEGATVHQGALLVCGSMSLKRKRPQKKHDTRGKVLKRLGKVAPASGPGLDFADRIYRLEVTIAAGQLQASLTGSWELRTQLLSVALLAPFSQVPSKDNGLDVEAMSSDGAHVWLGLRGPVLRGQALLARLGDDLSAPQLFPLKLRGHGIRAMTWEPAGTLLIVAGPTMTMSGGFSLWRWTPPADGGGRGLGTLVMLTTLAAPEHPDAKFESVFLWRGNIRLLLDGPAGGAPFLLKAKVLG